jgi:hypothetical protein
MLDVANKTSRMGLVRGPRARAFLLHLGMSLAVIGTVLSLVYFAWFPAALFRASGGLEGWTIVAAVDVVLGPILTFVVFDIAKSRLQLTFDIGVIVALQLAALAAGVYVVHHARPIAVVHAFDTFHVLRQQDFAAHEVDSKPLETFPGAYPKVLYVETEKTAVAFATKAILDGLNQQKPLHLRPDLYRPMPRDRSEAARILRRPKDDPMTDCIPQDIASAYTAGTICFHPDRQRFTDFVEGATLSYAPDMPEPETQ